MQVLLISTYDLGRQPFGLASPAAWIRETGATVICADLSRDSLPESVARNVDLIAIHLPMHTATRLALPLIERLKNLNRQAHVCCYGLYGPPNEVLLRQLGVHTVLGAEVEAELVALVEHLQQISSSGSRASNFKLEEGNNKIPRLRFRVPDRTGLPALSRYASLCTGDGQRLVTGYTEASRGCRHLCRHCPIVPIYQGAFRVVPIDVVVADVRAQVDAGAKHITFGDPDFFNGPRHAVRVVEALARSFSNVTYDVTIKIQHLLSHSQYLRVLSDTGCLFVTSAVESVDDRVLALLDKGHTRKDFERAVELCERAKLSLSPTFVTFTPWTSVESYVDLLETIVRLDLVEVVSPIQLGVRLLIPKGSKLLELSEIRSLVEPFDQVNLIYPWRNLDPRVDMLQRDVMKIIGLRGSDVRRSVFNDIRSLAREAAGLRPEMYPPPARPRATVPYLDEPWYC